MSEEQRKSGVPTIYIFPSKRKSLPYTKMNKFGYAEDIIKFIAEKATNKLKLKLADFEGLGKRSVDELSLHRRIDREGVIKLNEEYDEL